MNIINIAYSGLQASQIGMGVTSMNVANMLTPGYTRQSATQSSVGPLGEAGMSAGSGVRVDSIRRVSDQYLVNQIWQSNTKAEYYGMTDQYTSALEKVVGTDSTSLGTGFDDFFSALSSLTTQPESEANRQQLLNQGNALATRFNSMDAFIGSQKEQIHSQRDALVIKVNTLSEQIADYNKKITESEASGGNSNTLRDQRDDLVKELSGVIDVNVTEDANSNYTVALKGGQPLVSGRTAGTLSTDYDTEGNSSLNLSFSKSDFPLSPSVGGEMGALYDYETGTLQDMRDSIRGMAESFATQFNDQLAQGYDLNGDPGQPMFIYDPTSPKGILQVTDLQPDQIALSGQPDEPGNGDNLQSLIEIKNKKVDIPGMGNMSLNEGAAAIVSNIGIASKQTKAELSAAQAVSDQAQVQRDNVSAVNQDEEAINLQTYMQAYQANMKVISTGNQVFSDLLGLF
ncbi:MAG TPA: flagellar hook-associated protein FlgK [Scandinavium sp.]|jgi:flagellar hook-associated protein 1 FlgK|uniref:flagellar hook-associated protein FlgK n=1 Tax=Scandinavium sp. TaxID=2830653 RepID=UPI002E37E0DB|nr:flagellar hook-associated protein FlgK [Scandinavium sp.]HEX4499783.1 flagellar hook-associated protein FlgK [Scandinavium sp.]